MKKTYSAASAAFRKISAAFLSGFLDGFLPAAMKAKLEKQAA